MALNARRTPGPSGVRTRQPGQAVGGVLQAAALTAVLVLTPSARITTKRGPAVACALRGGRPSLLGSGPLSDVPHLWAQGLLGDLEYPDGLVVVLEDDDAAVLLG